VNIAIIRVFVKLRRVLAANKELANRLNGIERDLRGHNAELGAHAKQIRLILDSIRQLMAPPKRPHKRIGFKN